MALLDREEPTTEPAGTVDVGPDGGEFKNIRSDKPITDWTRIFKEFDLDPDHFTIAEDTVRMSKWQQSKRLENGERDLVWLYSYSARFTRRVDARAAAQWLASLIKPVTPLKPAKDTGLPMVVCLADAQIGKDGPGASGPEELDGMYQRALAKVAGMVKSQRPSILVIADNGDPIEGITSSAPNQIATNWLEFPEQLQAWQRRLTEAILTLAPFAGETHVAAVPSNHGEVRNTAGKVGYGDHGIGVAKTVEEAFGMLAPDRFPLTFHYPPTKYDVNTYVDVDGTVVAFTHGHHAGTYDRIPQWVANQAASTVSPMADARIVCHGHFHQPGYRESRGRAIVSCSMFDAGSAWFENKTGEHSRPSITTFSIKDSRVYELRFVEP